MTRRRYRYWTRATAAAAMRELFRALGRAPAVLDIRAHEAGPCVRTVVKLFGSIRKMQIAIGATPNARGAIRRARCQKGHHKGTARRCRICARASEKARIAARAIAQRVITPEVAARHSPDALARYWGMAS